VSDIFTLHRWKRGTRKENKLSVVVFDLFLWMGYFLSSAAAAAAFGHHHPQESCDGSKGKTRLHAKEKLARKESQG
jgi:hypothetical protein